MMSHWSVNSDIDRYNRMLYSDWWAVDLELYVMEACHMEILLNDVLK